MKRSVAHIAFFSSFADNILWAIYPPPPGSAPGYHTAHHWTARGIINTAINKSRSAISGIKLNLGITSGWFRRLVKPWIWGSDTISYAAQNVASIAKINWKKSVIIIPLNPPIEL